MSVDFSLTAQLPPAKFSQRWHWGSNQPISFLMQQGVENPEVISLAAGLVDPATLPVSETREAVEELLRDEAFGRQVLQYGTTAGNLELRRQLLSHLARLDGCTTDELGFDTDQMILTTGSQQLLSLVAEVLLDPGDICLVAAPTYFVFLGTLNGVGAKIIPVDTDGDGMRMDGLTSELQKLAANGELNRVKLIYLVSYYENPSGVSLSLERRQQVVEIARQWSTENRIFVLEDAAYRELQYDGPQLPSICSFDPTHETVILAQTFSKSFSPGLRVGFGVVPRDLVGPLCDRKGNEDFGSANFNQHLLNAVLGSERYEQHVGEIRDAYREKRDSMLAAADEYFTDLPGVEWVHPHGGLYVWMTVPPSVNTGFDGQLFQEAVRNQKVMYVPGDLCFTGTPAERPRNHMRLSFGVQTPEGIHEGMRRLATAVRNVLPE